MNDAQIIKQILSGDMWLRRYRHTNEWVLEHMDPYEPESVQVLTEVQAIKVFTRLAKILNRTLERKKA